MDQTGEHKAWDGDKPLISQQKARTKTRGQKQKRLPPPEDTSSRKRDSDYGPPPTKISRTAHPATTFPIFGAISLPSQQTRFHQAETPQNLSVPSFDPYFPHSQTSNDHTPAPGSLPSASATLSHVDSHTDRTMVPHTGIRTVPHHQNMAMNDGTHHTYNPAAPAPFNPSMSITTPLESSQSGRDSQSPGQPFVPLSVYRFPFSASASHPPLMGSSSHTAPHRLNSIPSVSGTGLSQQSGVIDPDPSVYINSLQCIHGDPFAYHNKSGAHTILAMNLEKLNADTEKYRIATRCVHYRSHTPDGWDAFNRPSGLSSTSPKDERVERNQCFMDELAIEQRLPSPGDLKRVWENSWEWASQEQSKQRRSLFIPRKDDSTNWDVSDRAFHLLAGCIDYHLRTTNPNPRIATVRRCKTPQAFDKLSSPDRVPVEDSFLAASRIDAKQFALLTGDRPVTTSVPNLTVGSVDLRSAKPDI
jgi:hypothetical protein